MIFKSFEINKIDFEKNTFYLFYGENDGLVFRNIWVMPISKPPK